MKKPWVAALLAFFLFPFSGGYIYLRKWADAVVWFIVILVIIGFQKPVLFLFVVLITTWDCYRTAKKDNQKTKEAVEKAEKEKRLVEAEKKRKLAKAKIEAARKAKGLIEFNGVWGTPGQVKKWKEIEVDLDKNFTHLSHFEFENFVGELFKKMGYDTTVTRKTGDFGVDVIARNSKDTIAIQVKQNAPGNHVGAVIVQNVLGSMWQYKANKAIIITTSDFTVQAEQQAREAPIELWDKRILHEMVREYFINKTKPEKNIAEVADA